MSRFSTAVRLLLATICGLSALAAGAAELRCTVRSVRGDSVTLDCAGGAAPQPGDPATLGYDVPGVGFVALEGLWRVTLIGPGGEAQAGPEAGPHGQPQIGNLALVETTAAAIPAPAAAAAPEAREDLPPVARTPRLGIRLAPEGVDGDSQGAEVEEVEPGGAAERAGLRAGDVVLTLDGTPTPDSRALVDEIRRRQAGDLVRLRVLRFPAVHEFDATLEAPSLDDPDLQYLIGVAYLRGDGVPPDRTEAERWIRRAAANGSADAAAALAPPQPSPADFFRPSPGSQASAGVFVVGTESGNRPALYQVDPAVRRVAAYAGANVLPLPADVPFAPGQAPKPAAVSQALAGRGWLLYLDLKLKWAAIGFAKDRITVTCYDPSGKKQWSEEASNTFANSRDHSTSILIDRITQKLGARAGQECLRP